MSKPNSEAHRTGNNMDAKSECRFSPVLENCESDNEIDYNVQNESLKLDNFEISDAMLDELPWHHIQLYKLYGKEADDFLHPKIDQEIMNQFVKPKRHSNIRLDGMTADELWSKLRDDSTVRLLRRDRGIKHELKAAYSAFIRQCAQQNKTPVKRNFYDKDDVPEIDLLMDQSVSQAVQSYNLKCQLMYRSSLNNENKAEILHHNNPIPNLNDLEGNETIERYLPSWWTTINADDNVSVKSYEKWLREPNVSSRNSSRQQSVTSSRKSSSIDLIDFNKKSVPSSATTKLSEAKLLAQKQDKEDWQELLLPKRRQQTFPRLRFLGDKKAVITGDFGKRCKEIEESELKNKQFISSGEIGLTQPLNKVMTARNDNNTQGSTQKRRCQSEPLLTTEEYNKHFQTTWEPLTEKALIEYKQWIDVVGSGDFNYGRAKIWHVAEA